LSGTAESTNRGLDDTWEQCNDIKHNALIPDQQQKQHGSRFNHSSLVGKEEKRSLHRKKNVPCTRRLLFSKSEAALLKRSSIEMLRWSDLASNATRRAAAANGDLEATMRAEQSCHGMPAAAALLLTHHCHDAHQHQGFGPGKQRMTLPPMPGREPTLLLSRRIQRFEFTPGEAAKGLQRQLGAARRC
jgi:hypothetical protein